MSRHRAQTVVALRSPSPDWTPINPEQAARIAVCRARWDRRHVVEPDDETVAEHVFANYSWGAGCDQVPWSVVKAGWRLDEADLHLACDLCGGALAFAGLGHSLSSGGIRRDCLRCRVSYHDGVGFLGVHTWLERLPAGLRPGTALLTFITRGFGRACPPAGQTAEQQRWARFLERGHWTRYVPRQWGRFLTTDPGGHALALRQVELGETAQPMRREHRAFRGWWWSEALPVGVEELPWGLDSEWRGNERTPPVAWSLRPR